MNNFWINFKFRLGVLARIFVSKFTAIDDGFIIYLFIVNEWRMAYY